MQNLQNGKVVLMKSFFNPVYFFPVYGLKMGLKADQVSVGIQGQFKLIPKGTHPRSESGG